MSLVSEPKRFRTHLAGADQKRTGSATLINSIGFFLQKTPFLENIKICHANYNWKNIYLILWVNLRFLCNNSKLVLFFSAGKDKSVKVTKILLFREIPTKIKPNTVVRRNNNKKTYDSLKNHQKYTIIFLVFLSPISIIILP